MSLADAWERYSAEWILWARTPGHDAFWDSTWPELVKVLPPPEGLAIEIGCGEGRVSRHLLASGYKVVAVEQSPTLARAARRGDPPVAVALADAASLPIADGSAALVVACMVLQDVDDLGATVNEIARVLSPGGRLCFAIVHPFASARDPETYHAEGPFTASAPYLMERRYVDVVDTDGLVMTFVSAHRPLSAYINAMASASLSIDAMREFGRKTVPWLLVSRATKGSA